jgi:hypothetical protein
VLLNDEIEDPHHGREQKWQRTEEESEDADISKYTMPDLELV